MMMDLSGREIKNIGIIMLAAVILVGCKLGSSYTRKQNMALDGYYNITSEGESVANMAWWELFGDTVLQELIILGLESNRDLRAAAARITEAEARLGIVRADLYPRINYNADGAITGATGDNSSSSASTTIGVSYQVDLWGRYRNLSEAAFQEYLATEEGYRNITIAIVSSIANGYLLLRDLDNRLIISEETAETWQDNLNITEARFHAGMVSEVDVKQSIIQVEEAKSSIQTFVRLRRQTQNGLSVLLGQSPKNIQRGLPLQEQLFPPALPTGLPSELLDRRPDLLAVERRLEAQTARIGAAEALKYPQLNLSASLGASFANPAVGFASLGAQIFGPIFNNEENKRKVEVEIARTEQLLNEYEGTFLNALREVEDALIAVDTYGKEFDSRIKQLDAASLALDMAWVRYESGLTSYLEILDLQRSQFSSKLKASEILQLQLTSSINLYKALGGGWQVPTDSTSIN
ncbi:MAG: efflux transporter outer membrane subunit [Nitrosomonadaceae bacterium]|nr:efflux transporter outer membrane subunit [Nitrosomonadaceae bacterium]